MVKPGAGPLWKDALGEHGEVTLRGFEQYAYPAWYESLAGLVRPLFAAPHGAARMFVHASCYCVLFRHSAAPAEPRSHTQSSEIALLRACVQWPSVRRLCLLVPAAVEY